MKHTKTKTQKTNAEHSLFDLQVNGYAGVDYQQEGITLAQLRASVVAQVRRGVGGFLLTLITDDSEAIERKLSRFEAFRQEDPLLAKVIVGYHLEGPYLNTEDGFRGAHPASAMKAPDWSEFQRWQTAAGGNIRLITLAPEWPGSDAFIQQAVASGVRVAIGHSNANEEEIRAAIDAGMSLATHVGNAVPQKLHRHNNVIQRLLAEDALIACLIPDGIHLPPNVLKNFYRAKPSGKVILVTDAMAAADAKPGRYTLGPLELEVGADGVVRMPGKDSFAGSSLTLDTGVRNASRWLGESQLILAGCASTIPAEHFGINLPAMETVQALI